MRWALVVRESALVGYDVMGVLDSRGNIDLGLAAIPSKSGDMFLGRATKRVHSLLFSHVYDALQEATLVIHLMTLLFPEIP